jgi:YggT family protein
MDVVLVPLIWLANEIITLYIWVVIIGVVLSWLVSFNVVNTGNRFVYLVGDFVARLTEPALRPIRGFLPHLGGIDVSPVILILLLVAIQKMLGQIAYRVG